MKRIFIFVFCFYGLVGELLATHIVGGEIQMQYLNTNNRYRFIVNLYFDQINGNSQAEDANIILAIYRRRNNQLVQSFTLNKSSQAFVPYQGSDCQQQFLSTRLIRYLADVDLNPNNYRDTEGYYAIWERCCRNNVVSNIVASGDAGSVFYLWFPAIEQGGQPFRNNTPAFSMPAGDYLCLGKDFSTNNFAATDADGDQLVYSMVTPFNGYSNRNNPDPFNNGNIPNPYGFPPPTVTWATGFSATNAITSSVGQPLTINATTGELSVNPNRTGLFVFSIRCEEFRNGVKIGEVRRDFQFLVRECKENFPPVVSIPLPNNPSQNYQEGDTLTIDANSNNLCFDVKITDAPRENIKSIAVKKVSGNFNFRTNPLSVSSVRTDNNGNAIVQFCWIKCLYSKDKNDIFVFDIIAKDDACPYEGVDTLRVKLRVLPKFNILPQLKIIRASNNVNISAKTITTKVNEVVEIVFEGTDANNDELSLEALINGEPVDLLGFQFIDSIKAAGRVVSRFYWLPDCRTIKQNGETQEYLIDFVLKEENNECDSSSTKMTFKLTLTDEAVDISTFIPANAFTPNGDGVNDFFTLPNLPVENCYYRFANIKIYNRWGRKVFEADTKNFAWSGDIFPAGVYYYIIDYTNSIYKGTVTILR
jgi:gliding motility-associated-like protein